MTTESEAERAFDVFLDANATTVADVARAIRRTVAGIAPDLVETFDAADGLLAFGTGGSRRAFWFAIIPHTVHVNLQLADGAELPDPDGRIEGTGKRIRHVKVRSVEDATSPWLKTVIERQLVYRTDAR